MLKLPLLTQKKISMRYASVVFRLYLHLVMDLDKIQASVRSVSIRRVDAAPYMILALILVAYKQSNIMKSTTPEVRYINFQLETEWITNAAQI